MESDVIKIPLGRFLDGIRCPSCHLAMPIIQWHVKCQNRSCDKFNIEATPTIRVNMNYEDE